MMETVLGINLISSDPQIRGGRPCIVGTGLRVIDVVMAQTFHNRTPGEIATDYEVSLAEVHAALAYYYQHQVELDADIRDQLAKAQMLREEWQAKGGTPLLP